MSNYGRGVSCIVRTCNRPDFLERALSSICSQSYRDIQVIIVNDGGQRETLEALLARKFASGNGLEIEVVHHERQMGRWVAGNAGLRRANREFVHIHDDDDTIHPDFYQKLCARLTEVGDQYFGVCSFIECVNEVESGSFYREQSRHPWSLNRQGVCIADLAVRNPIVPIGLVYQRSMHDLVGEFREELPVLGDWEFYLRAFCHKSIDILSEDLAYYYLRPASTAANANSITGNLDQHYQYDAYIRDYYFRNTEEFPKLGELLVNGRLIRDTRRTVEVNGSPLRLLLRRLTGRA